MSVAEALQEQIKRVRDEVIPQYEEVSKLPGVNCAPALKIIRVQLDLAVQRLAEGDAIGCMVSLNELEGVN